MSRRKPYVKIAPKKTPPVMWRSLEEKNDPEAYRKRADEHEFEGGAPLATIAGIDVETKAIVGRRGFLTGTAATAAAVGAAACIRRPAENILPYTSAPEYLVPGVPLHYATVLERRGEALGVLVTTHTGRPTKIEGNPEHPASNGATDLIAQASILDLYDPDRAKQPRHAGADASYADFDEFFAAHRRTLGTGEKLRVLAQPTSSPTFLRLRAAVTAAYPAAKFHTWSATGTSHSREGARIAFGAPLTALVDYRAADVILALDSDFLGTEPGAVRANRAFADGRRLRQPQDRMSRLYVVEPGASVTGGNADHRLRLPASQVGMYLRALAKALADHGVGLGELGAALGDAEPPTGVPAHWIRVVAQDLARARGKSAIVVGSGQPPAVHALAHAVNDLLGNNGSVITFAPPADPDEPDQATSLTELCTAMDADQVDTLLILGGNPCYDTPGDLGFTEKLRKVDTSIQLSHNRDETSGHVTWHVPRAHELETWGDARSLDGTVAVQQPVIAPLWGARSEIELLGLLAGERNWRGHPLVRATHGLAEVAWRATIQRGVVGTGASPASGTSLVAGNVVRSLQESGEAIRPPERGRYEVVFQPCVKMMDGRHANNPWLQELPDPTTRIVWDNAALVSPRTFEALGLQRGNPTVHWKKIRLTREGAPAVEVVAYEQRGVADWTVVLPLGWGRRSAGQFGSDVGFDANPFRSHEALWFVGDVQAAASGDSHNLSQVQEQHTMADRPIAIDATLEEYRESPEFAQYRQVEPSTQPLWQQVEYTGHKWGLSIDLNACTGCNACVIACQAENNVPWVGKDQIQRGRDMYWLRLDRYFVGESEHDPAIAVQPVACMQCEEAPCENVCPVNATTHSPEGLNDMAYNRCIGTRYCANNCPYKVRRFNYLNWNRDEWLPETLRMQKNPNVTVRFRGVMEKCTYCVQRIQEAKIAARREDRPMRPGPTACAQACPAGAIVFGDLNDPESDIARLATLDRHYKMLADIGTQPRTTYLARVRNPNPEMPA